MRALQLLHATCRNALIQAIKYGVHQTTLQSVNKMSGGLVERGQIMLLKCMYHYIYTVFQNLGGTVPHFSILRSISHISPLTP